MGVVVGTIYFISLFLFIPFAFIKDMQSDNLLSYFPLDKVKYSPTMNTYTNQHVDISLHCTYLVFYRSCACFCSGLLMMWSISDGESKYGFLLLLLYHYWLYHHNHRFIFDPRCIMWHLTRRMLLYQGFFNHSFKEIQSNSASFTIFICLHYVHFLLIQSIFLPV